MAENTEDGLNQADVKCTDNSFMMQSSVTQKNAWYSLSFAEARIKEFAEYEPLFLFQQEWSTFSWTATDGVFFFCLSSVMLLNKITWSTVSQNSIIQCLSSTVFFYYSCSIFFSLDHFVDEKHSLFMYIY